MGRWRASATKRATRGMERGREVGRGVTGPAGKEEKGSWAGLFLEFGLVGVSSSFSFLIQTNLTPNESKFEFEFTQALKQIKSMLQHDATTKFKLMINFNYL